MHPPNRCSSPNGPNTLSVADIISYVSQTATLEPGDLVLTGTPAGVGVFRNPPVGLKDGDEVTVEIEQVGKLTNRVHVH